MKRPAFQFYPADWRKDPALSACSLAARGLWIELMCIAHESDEYGVLSINGKAMSDAQLARMVGEAPKTLAKLLDELEDAGVFSRNESRAIFSRRMVKDERIRTVRADAGRLGGNPDLLKEKVKQIGPDLLNQNEEQKPTPSSSSSSSTSGKPHSGQPAVGTEKPKDAAAPPATRGTRLPKDWVLPMTWGEKALELRPDWHAEQVRQAADKFRDYWIAQPGQKGVKTDWGATWRNWVRNEPMARSTGNGTDRASVVAAFTGADRRPGEPALQGEFKRVD